MDYNFDLQLQRIYSNYNFYTPSQLEYADFAPSKGVHVKIKRYRFQIHLNIIYHIVLKFYFHIRNALTTIVIKYLKNIYY